MEKDSKKVSNKKIIKTILFVVIIAFSISFVQFIQRDNLKSHRNSAVGKVVNYFTDNSVWKDFDSTSGSFHVSFPTYPSHETNSIKIKDISLDMEIYSSKQADGTTYMVAFATYPAEVDTSIPENNLEGSVNGSVQSVDGNLISSSFTFFEGYRAIEYLIQKDDRSFYVRGKNILVDHVMYQVAVVYEPANDASAQYEKFVNSFKLR